eukprot:4193878-Alexandrium_andersonii.AAC.1
MLRATQYVPGINPEYAPPLTPADRRALAAQAATAITEGIQGTAGRGSGGRKGTGAGKGKGRGKGGVPQVPGPAGGTQTPPISHVVP